MNRRPQSNGSPLAVVSGKEVSTDEKNPSLLFGRQISTDEVQIRPTIFEMSTSDLQIRPVRSGSEVFHEEPYVQPVSR